MRPALGIGVRAGSAGTAGTFLVVVAALLALGGFFRARLGALMLMMTKSGWECYNLVQESLGSRGMMWKPECEEYYASVSSDPARNASRRVDNCTSTISGLCSLSMNDKGGETMASRSFLRMLDCNNIGCQSTVYHDAVRTSGVSAEESRQPTSSAPTYG